MAVKVNMNKDQIAKEWDCPVFLRPSKLEHVIHIISSDEEDDSAPLLRSRYVQTQSNVEAETSKEQRGRTEELARHTEARFLKREKGSVFRGMTSTSRCSMHVNKNIEQWYSDSDSDEDSEFEDCGKNSAASAAASHLPLQMKAPPAKVKRKFRNHLQNLKRKKSVRREAGTIKRLRYEYERLFEEVDYKSTETHSGYDTDDESDELNVNTRDIIACKITPLLERSLQDCNASTKVKEATSNPGSTVQDSDYPELDSDFEPDDLMFFRDDCRDFGLNYDPSIQRAGGEEVPEGQVDRGDEEDEEDEDECDDIGYESNSENVTRSEMRYLVSATQQGIRVEFDDFRSIAQFTAALKRNGVKNSGVAILYLNADSNEDVRETTKSEARYTVTFGNENIQRNDADRHPESFVVLEEEELEYESDRDALNEIELNEIEPVIDNAIEHWDQVLVENEGFRNRIELRNSVVDDLDEVSIDLLHNENQSLATASGRAEDESYDDYIVDQSINKGLMRGNDSEDEVDVDYGSCGDILKLFEERYSGSLDFFNDTQPNGCNREDNLIASASWVGEELQGSIQCAGGEQLEHYTANITLQTRGIRLGESNSFVDALSRNNFPTETLQAECYSKLSSNTAGAGLYICDGCCKIPSSDGTENPADKLLQVSLELPYKFISIDDDTTELQDVASGHKEKGDRSILYQNQDGVSEVTTVEETEGVRVEVRPSTNTILLHETVQH